MLLFRYLTKSRFNSTPCNLFELFVGKNVSNHKQFGKNKQQICWKRDVASPAQINVKSVLKIDASGLDVPATPNKFENDHLYSTIFCKIRCEVAFSYFSFANLTKIEHFYFELVIFQKSDKNTILISVKKKNHGVFTTINEIFSNTFFLSFYIKIASFYAQDWS